MISARRYLLAAALASGSVVLAACGSSSSAKSARLLAASANPTPATITAQGVGTALGEPDTATVDIGVSTSALHAATALADNNRIAAAVQAALAKDGVSGQDVSTTGLSLYQMGPPTNGYQVSDQVTATLHDLAEAGTVIDDALAPAGDSGRLEGVTLSMSDTDPVLAAARQQAVSSARAQAQQMATAAGLQLGPLVSLSDQQGAGFYQSFAGYQNAASAGPAGVPVPIQPGSQQMSVTVTAVWHTESQK